MGTKCTNKMIQFPALKKRQIVAAFNGGNITSDAGALLLRAIDKKIGLTKALKNVIPEWRDTNRCVHGLDDLMRQRIYGLALGYEDLNDHDELRLDSALQVAINRNQPLASSPTLCRYEQHADNKTAWKMHEVMVDQFIASYKKPPKRIMLDFDATDDPVHGNQEGRFFHGYYDHYCFLPLYVFADQQMLVSYLRPSKIDGAKHAWAILALLTKRLRQAWPKVKITFRGDGGFCRWKMLRWCEKNDVDYIVGIAKNSRLTNLAKQYTDHAEWAYNEFDEAQKIFGKIWYQAKSWDKARKIIVKAEHLKKGSNPRFIVTTLRGEADFLYRNVYCIRGEMENRIKEQQLGLFADRTSCHYWWANQLRLLMSSMAYILIESIRRIALVGTKLSTAQVSTIRNKLFKIGAVIMTNTRKIKFMMPTSYPHQDVFALVSARLVPD